MEEVRREVKIIEAHRQALGERIFFRTVGLPLQCGKQASIERKRGEAWKGGRSIKYNDSE